MKMKPLALGVSIAAAAAAASAAAYAFNLPLPKPTQSPAPSVGTMMPIPEIMPVNVDTSRSIIDQALRAADHMEYNQTGRIGANISEAGHKTKTLQVADSTVQPRFNNNVKITDPCEINPNLASCRSPDKICHELGGTWSSGSCNLARSYGWRSTYMEMGGLKDLHSDGGCIYKMGIDTSNMTAYLKIGRIPRRDCSNAGQTYSVPLTNPVTRIAFSNVSRRVHYIFDYTPTNITHYGQKDNGESRFYIKPW